MQKIIVLFLLLFITVNIKAKNIIQYSEAVDVFEIVEHASAWHADSISEYGVFFEETLKLTREDKALLDQYGDFRKKYQVKQKALDHSLFPKQRILPDMISNAFEQSKSVGDAINTLVKRKRISKIEKKFLVKFFKHFQTKLTIMVKESTVLKSKVKELNKLLKSEKIVLSYRKVRKFFKPKSSYKKSAKIFLVWWPLESGVQVDFRGESIILRVNPITASSDLVSSKFSEILIKGLLSSLSKNKQENFSKIFLDNCNILKKRPSFKVYSFFERPLVNALGRLSQLYLFKKKSFNPYVLNYHSPWEKAFSIELFTLFNVSLKSKKDVHSNFFLYAGGICQTLLDI